jgi:hypothetical protein
LTTLADPFRSRAVLIGVSDYQHLTPLPAVTNNLADLARFLRDPGTWGLPPENCVVVANPSHSHSVLEPLHNAAGSAGDVLFVYFAGHGLLNDESELCLALPEASQSRQHCTVRFADIRREIVYTAQRCLAKVVILDCCYSGRAMSGYMSDDDRLVNQAAVEGTFLMTATAETTLALAPIGARYTAFTGSLLDTIRNGVPAGPTLLDMETLFSHTEEDLRASGRPIPRRRSRDNGSDIAIVRNRAANARQRRAAPAPPVRPPADRAAQPWNRVSADREPVRRPARRPPDPGPGTPATTPAGRRDVKTGVLAWFFVVLAGVGGALAVWGLVSVVPEQALAPALWIGAVILVVAGVTSIVRGQLLWGVTLIVAGLCIGPGGVSIFS